MGPERVLHTRRPVSGALLLGHALDRQRSDPVRHGGHGAGRHPQHRLSGRQIRFYAQRRPKVLRKPFAAADAHTDGGQLLQGDPRLYLRAVHYLRESEHV